MFWSNALSDRCSLFGDSFVEDKMVNSGLNPVRLLTLMAPTVCVISYDATSKDAVTKEGSGKRRGCLRLLR
jgi:hypothetical protein